QFEFAASGRGAELAYPWGNDDPECPDAIFELGGLGDTQFYARACRNDALIDGVHAPGSGARDRMTLADPASGTTRTILDLGGNLSEWTVDYYLDQTDPFWSAPGVRTDPVSNTTPAMGDDINRTFRGGSFVDTAAQLRAGARRPGLDTT